MTGTRPRLPAVVAVLLSLALAGCPGKKNPGGPSDPQERLLLIQLNASQNGGRTVRWADLPISVSLNGIGTEVEVTEWTRASDGKVTFAFVDGGGGITFGFTGERGICGVTDVEFDDDGRIRSAAIRVVEAVFRGPQCQRTVTHETGHAIGILGHTSDGGLMDDDGGDGRITGDVAGMVRNLYSLKPGTFIGFAEGTRRAAARRAGGRHVVTIVDPIRR